MNNLEPSPLVVHRYTLLLDGVQDGMVVFVSLFGPVQMVYEKFREDSSKSWKKLMKVKMKIQFTIPKETLELSSLFF